MTQETYCAEREGVDQDEKKDDDKKKKKKSVAFKASTSSKSKSKAKKEESSEDEEVSDIDDEALALFVHKFGKFIEGLWCKKEKRSKQEQRLCKKMLQV
jgi:hypothetical protein